MGNLASIIYAYSVYCLLADIIRGVAAIHLNMFLQHCVNPPCCVPDSERQDQPEDQGEVLVSCRKHF